MKATTSAASLDDLLRGVSRSFYLTLKVVPRKIRRQIGTAYLFCRAADTIADTKLLPAKERLGHLATYRAQFEADSPRSEDLETIASRLGQPTVVGQEKELLGRLDECFAQYQAFSESDRKLVGRLVTTLTRGMQMDLESFPPEESGQVGALSTDEDLDRYCYYVAGCVGEFWTELQCAHFAALRRWDVGLFREKGVRFGKGLQLTNILRDADKDLAIGRCYIPQSRLDDFGLTASALRAANERSTLRPVVHELIRLCLAHYRAGWEYTLAIPRRLVTLRLACVWPLWIGLRTLALLARAPDPCSPGVVLKIRRPEVRRLRSSSLLCVLSNHALDRRYEALERGVEKELVAGRKPLVSSG